MTTVTMFVENEAGSPIKHHYNEVTLDLLGTEDVGAPYPFPYGFVPGTLAPDGDCIDCFALTDRRLTTGERVEGRPVALLEQTEGGITDHNLLVVPSGDPVPDLEGAVSDIGAFLEVFMKGVPGREAVMGRLLPVEDALDYLNGHTL